MKSHQLVAKLEVLEKFHDSIRLANRDDRNRSCSSVKAALLVPDGYDQLRSDRIITIKPPIPMRSDTIITILDRDLIRTDTHRCVLVRVSRTDTMCCDRLRLLA